MKAERDAGIYMYRNGLKEGGKLVAPLSDWSEYQAEHGPMAPILVDYDEKDVCTLKMFLDHPDRKWKPLFAEFDFEGANYKQIIMHLRRSPDALVGYLGDETETTDGIIRPFVNPEFIMSWKGHQ